jgi:60 kDa SS-A/Ro ribonucleoprotein
MSTIQTYRNALQEQIDKQNGLTTTNQGGQAYEIDALRQFRRFLILGAERPTFYIKQEKLAAKNIAAVTEALKQYGTKAIDEIVAISDAGRAPKNDPALLALAIAASFTSDNKQEQQVIRDYALSHLKDVARTGTHLFHFAEYVNALRGWGPGLRKAFANWYLSRSEKSLAEQVTKYVQRDGWSHRDLLRLSHVKANTEAQNAIFKYVTSGELPVEVFSQGTEYLAAVEAVKRSTDTNEIISLINQYGLPREVLPTQALNDPKVWEALLYAGKGMPLTALVRNLGTMSKIGLLTQGSDASRYVLDRLDDQDGLLKSRIHPIDLLKAKMVYANGQGLKSSATWTPVQPVVYVLETAFYKSFGNVEPTNKRLCLALDVSGSMTSGERTGSFAWYGAGREPLAGVPGLSPRIASGALALITARTERDYEIYGFTTNYRQLNISGHDSLETVLKKISDLPFGGTDCALPFREAQRQNKKFDAFIVYTDSETGGGNPSAALRQYRASSGIHDAKLIVNAMEANNFSIADPRDRNMLDVVGFDTAAPQIMSEFIRGGI